MEELKKIKSPYRVCKTEKGYIIECDDVFCFEEGAVIWSEEKQRWIIAFKRYYTDYTYDVEYVLFTEKFEIDEVYQESEGVNPSFILAPNKEIWVVMSATRECYAEETDVTIPLFKRSRIDEPVVKRDTGMDSFFLGGQTFGFIRDEWGRGKDSKFVLHQYDKHGLYKNRKEKTLVGIKGGFVTSINEKAYLFANGLYEISDKLEIELIGDFEEEQNYLSVLLDMDEETITFLRRDEEVNNIDFVKYTRDGKQTEKKTVYNSKEEIYWMKIESEIDGSQMISFFAGGVITMGYKNGEFCIYEGEVGMSTKMMKYGLMFYGNSSRQDTKVEIIRMKKKDLII